ncbi:MAG: sigma-70 family RNA polymerase sigma factor [Planctomycetaceae bacterium]|nr:sigma-70 family RNA polymerase sigma factor [Planctomycetaceae bacterium]
MSEETLSQVEQCLQRFQDGDPSARDELINLTYNRLLALTRKISRTFPNVKRWEETQDVAQAACLRLHQALERVELNDARHYFRLAAHKIRFELLDSARHYYGAEGIGQNHATQAGSPAGDASVGQLRYEQADVTHEPGQLAEMTELHRLVDELSDESREIFDLLYYHELTQEQAAELLGVSSRQVRRLWRNAQIEIGKRLQHDPPRQVQQ